SACSATPDSVLAFTTIVPPAPPPPGASPVLPSPTDFPPFAPLLWITPVPDTRSVISTISPPPLPPAPAAPSLPSPAPPPPPRNRRVAGSFFTGWPPRPPTLRRLSPFQSRSLGLGPIMSGSSLFCENV